MIRYFLLLLTILVDILSVSAQVERYTINQFRGKTSICGVPGIDLIEGFDCDIMLRSSMRDGDYLIYYDDSDEFIIGRKYNYDSLKLYIKASYKDRKREGTWSYYFKNGKLKKEIVFSNGNIVSWKGWGFYQNGSKFYEVELYNPLIRETSEKLDLKHRSGWLKCFTKTGTLQLSIEFDTIQQQVKYWDQKGRLVKENVYKRDSLCRFNRNYDAGVNYNPGMGNILVSGIRRIYWGDNSLQNEIIIKDSNVVEKEWDENGNIKHERYYITNRRKKADTTYWNQRRAGIELWRADFGLNPLHLHPDSIPEGIQMIYHRDFFNSNDSIWKKWNSDSFIPTGKWTEYNADGTVKSIFDYSNYKVTDSLRYQAYIYKDIQRIAASRAKVIFDTISISDYSNGGLKYVEYNVKRFDGLHEEGIGRKVVKSWYSNGSPDSLCFYRYDFQTGGKSMDSTCMWWYENGNKRKEITIYNFIERFYKEWYPDGKIKHHEFATSDNSSALNSLPLIRKSWYSDGTLSEVIFHKHINYSYGAVYKNERANVKFNQDKTKLSSESEIEIQDFGTVREFNGEYSFSYDLNMEMYKAYLQKDSLDLLKAQKLKFPGFAKIPSGTYESDSTRCSPVKLNSFFIQQTEVSNKQYREFVNVLLKDSLWVLGKEYIMHKLYPDTNAIDKIIVGKDSISLNNYFLNDKYNDYPVVGIDWWAAKYYCNWMYWKITQGFKGKINSKFIEVRLPSEAEWEYAASEGLGLHKYFSKKSNVGMNVSGSDPFPQVCHVKSFKPNKFGLYNMFGNVSEHCEDAYYRKGSRKNYVLVKDSRINQVYTDGDETRKVIRGGSFNDTLKSLFPYFRSFQYQDSTNYFNPWFYVMQPQGVFPNFYISSNRWNEYETTWGGDPWRDNVKPSLDSLHKPEYVLSYNYFPSKFYRKLAPSVGFRPVIMIIDPKAAHGKAIDCDWIEY